MTCKSSKSVFLSPPIASSVKLYPPVFHSAIHTIVQKIMMVDTTVNYYRLALGNILLKSVLSGFLGHNILGEIKQKMCTLIMVF